MKSNDRFSKAVCRKVAWYLYLILLSPSIFAVQGFNTQCPRGGKRRGLRGKGTSICMGHGCLSSLSGGAYYKFWYCLWCPGQNANVSLVKESFRVAHIKLENAVILCYKAIFVGIIVYILPHKHMTLICIEKTSC